MSQEGIGASQKGCMLREPCDNVTAYLKHEGASQSEHAPRRADMTKRVHIALHSRELRTSHIRIKLELWKDFLAGHAQWV